LINHVTACDTVVKRHPRLLCPSYESAGGNAPLCPAMRRPWKTA